MAITLRVVKRDSLIRSSPCSIYTSSCGLSFTVSKRAMMLYPVYIMLTHYITILLHYYILYQSTGVLTVAPGPYLSDHRAVTATLNTKKLQPKAKVKHIWKFHSVTSDQWNEAFDTNNTPLSSNLKEMVDNLNKELVRIQDELAPVKKCNILLKPKNPWYDQEMKALKRNMCKHEWKWIKYRLDSCWQAYKVTHNCYYAKLNSKKKDVLRSSIKECSRDSCKLLLL